MTFGLIDGAAAWVLTCDAVAGEGDHAKHGGGGCPDLIACGRPLHRLRRSPSPVVTGEDPRGTICGRTP
jgi:hypothetical protein